ncbi:MAG TPA: hypothetical protein VK550_21800 [Polyangiaceae bacterium]|nr:hypothetical protein [Polyangiaceae bacterium]
MSTNDAFDRAVQALRETGDSSAADVARTRTRVLDTLSRGERRGRRTFWVLLPIAAVLAGGAAFAKSDVVHRAWTGLAETVGIAAPAEKLAVPVAPLSGPANEVPTVGPVESVAAAEVVAPREPVVEKDIVPVAPRRQRAAGGAPRAAPPAAPASATVEPEAESAVAGRADDGEAAALQLYKDAYRLHFVEQRYAAALAAWDEYLRAVPAGRLVVEARYNRAIALVRLGRRSEAESALAPFARGEVSGGYRAREARELLDALNGSVP